MPEAGSSKDGLPNLDGDNRPEIYSATPAKGSECHAYSKLKQLSRVASGPTAALILI